jgi:hypothetical protein
MASAIVSIVTSCPGKAASNIRTYSGTAPMRASIISAFTGVSVSRIDIEPVAIDALAWASSEALRPSHPASFVSAWPRPITGCDLREVNFPESLRLFASRVAQASSGKWQVPHEVLPEADRRSSQNSARPSSTRAGFSGAWTRGRL